MPGCAAIGCNNRSEKGYTMKCFPRNPNLRRIWKERVSRADWEPSNNSFLCHVHFDSEQWILSQSRRLKLKKNAIPSIFTVTSTRKSPKKRRKLFKGRGEDFDYLDESSDPILTIQNTIGDTLQYTPNAIETSNEMHDANGRIVDREVFGEIKNSVAKVKPEMKSQLQSDQDLDDIETKLRLICDGEAVIDDRIDQTNGQESGKKHSIECSRRESMADKDTQNIEESIDLKRKSRYEIMRDMEKTVVDVKPAVKDEIVRQSKFTIKITGHEEDVEDIVEGLGVRQFKYKSDESSRNNQRFVTSVISVIDHPTSGVSMKKPKLEIDESLTGNAQIDWNWQSNSNLAKLSMESLNDDESTIYKRLHEKLLFQEQIIWKLTNQLSTRAESKVAWNSVNLRETTKKRRNLNNSSNQDNEESLICGLSMKLHNLENDNSNLSKKVLEKEQEKKKLELQIRQRDKRIKELNWKLEKASKYVERAEKNAITYRKKMTNMQSSIARRKIVEKKKDAARVELGSRTAQVESAVEILEEKFVVEDGNTIGDNGLYRTVQDIFDESNDCDDDSYVIDTREDFMRQFEDSFEPRVRAPLDI